MTRLTYFQERLAHFERVVEENKAQGIHMADEIDELRIVLALWPHTTSTSKPG
jgi:hypothetical protein